VDHDLGFVFSGHGDDLQEVPGSIGTEVEHLAVVLLGHNDGMIDRMPNVVVIDAVPVRRPEDLRIVVV
jgi:hypothetical protein